MVWQQKNYRIWVLSYPKEHKKSLPGLQAHSLNYSFSVLAFQGTNSTQYKCTVFPDCPWWSPIGSHWKPHISLWAFLWFGSCFWTHKKTCLYFLKQQQCPVVTLVGFKSSPLPCYLITSFHVKVHRVEKAYFSEQPNLQGYELLFNSHRALDIFFWCCLLSVYSFQSRVQSTAQI